MAEHGTQAEQVGLRQLEVDWNRGLIAVSIAISLLGAFTSTQLMCQARTSRFTSGVVTWTVLGSLTFGFCSIWSLHEVAMLAYEVDLQIELDVPLTVLSSALAVSFTFLALGGDLIWKSYKRGQRKKPCSWKRRNSGRGDPKSRRNPSAEALLQRVEDNDEEAQLMEHVRPTKSPSVLHRQHAPSGLHRQLVSDIAAESHSILRPALILHDSETIPFPELHRTSSQESRLLHARLGDDTDSDADDSTRTSSLGSSRRSLSFTDSTVSHLGMGKFMSIRTQRENKSASKNVFVLTAKILYAGFNFKNIGRAFVWSLAISGMHFVGIQGLKIPGGFVVLDPALSLLACLISWIVCGVGIILMAEMETNLGQQMLFSAVAAAGVAAMHFTGMAAVNFYTNKQPSVKRGYPPGLAAAIVGIAITTCIAANGLLAHSVILSRDKLAEVFYTRKKMSMAIAQKEYAEAAAAARSDFIASASHEIRTPLHQLQGYTDLLSRTELTEEGRLLLYAIQHATKTLSLITTNVLDWSRLEENGEKACQPVSLDMRQVTEAIINLLPNKDEENEADIFVVVAPDVPYSLFLDETYIHRILMNLLSNATKFTNSGYILLLIGMKDGKMVATLKDTGCGIPPTFLPQLFDPFTQAETMGAHRGTGLGLSIIKQLLGKMDGKIEVVSRYEPLVGVEACGSEFTVSIPVSTTEVPAYVTAISNIGVFYEGNERHLEGLRKAWKCFGTEIVHVKDSSDLARENIRHLWLDVDYLQRHPDLQAQLIRQRHLLVLVTYETQLAMDFVFGITALPLHFIPIRKPLIWHTILQTLSLVQAGRRKASPEKIVRFAPQVDSTDDAEPREAKHPTVLVVEDNKINLRLMQKMLTILKYSVLVAVDGQEAVDQILEHDRAIDAILMDQSMPKKDGLTATREIREMECSGILSKRHAIIAVTAVVSSKAQSMSEAAGTDDFLAKPVSLVKLGDCLEKWVKKT